MSLCGMVRPIDFLYEHLHESIRRELDSLGKGVLDLGTSIALGRGNESHSRSVAHSQLLALQDRYGFLEQVYKYHSLVEDEASESSHYFSRALPVTSRRSSIHASPCPAHAGVRCVIPPINPDLSCLAQRLMLIPNEGLLSSLPLVFPRPFPCIPWRANPAHSDSPSMILVDDAPMCTPHLPTPSHHDLHLS